MKKFARKKCRKIFLEAIFFALEKTFFKVSVQNFCHCLTRYHWPKKFLSAFLQIIRCGPLEISGGGIFYMDFFSVKVGCRNLFPMWKVYTIGWCTVCTNFFWKNFPCRNFFFGNCHPPSRDF